MTNNLPLANRFARQASGNDFMFEKRFHITLLFNANKVYDRQVIQGVGDYLQASQCDWDIFIEEDFHSRLNGIHHWLGDGIIADFDDPQIEQQLNGCDIPVVGVGGSYRHAQDYPPIHYIATDNQALISQAIAHLKQKGLSDFAFYGLPASPGKRWASEREAAFRQCMEQDNRPVVIYQGRETSPHEWQQAQDELAAWLQSLPPHTGIVAVTDARARHLLQICEHQNIIVPEKLCVIGIDNEEMVRCLSRVSLSSVEQGCREIGYQAAKLLHRLLNGNTMPLQRILIPPKEVIGRCSTDYRSIHDPAVIQAMHFIRFHACKGIKVEHVLDAINLSRTNLEARFLNETGITIHKMIHNEKLSRARELLLTSTLSINEIAKVCSYPTLPYFYSVFSKKFNMTPKEYRDKRPQ